MPFGYLVAVIVVAFPTLCVLAPPRHPPFLAAAGFRLAVTLNELPFIAFFYLTVTTLLAARQGNLSSPGSWATFGLASATAVTLAVITRRGLRTRPAIEAALTSSLGARWHADPDTRLAAGSRHRLPWARILLWPVGTRRRNITRVPNVRYGNAGKRNLLDLYHHRSRPHGCPVLIHLHGGGYVSGRKNSQSLPLLHRLAGHRWVCISANYRLRPAAGLPEHLTDAKKVIVWARRHAHEYGGDPATVFVAGSSAGAHLAVLAALTPNAPRFQPGFEDADTSVAAVVGLNGYYGPYYADAATDQPFSSPRAQAWPDAPPVFLAHGDHDTMTPVKDARQFVRHLRRTSSNPTVYAELPGGQHGFDLFHSVRFEAVIDGIEAFAAWVMSRADGAVRTENVD